MAASPIQPGRSCVSHFQKALEACPTDPGTCTVSQFQKELAAFPTGKNDDQVDQTTQAVNRLLLSPYLDMTDDVEPDEFAALDEQGFVYSPF